MLNLKGKGKKMGEILSPKQRLPRIQSPTSPFFLGSNDDNLERAQARAARAAAIRRKTIAAHSQLPPLQDPDPCLDKQQILDLFHNCIKLASENVRFSPPLFSYIYVSLKTIEILNVIIVLFLVFWSRK